MGDKKWWFVIGSPRGLEWISFLIWIVSDNSSGNLPGYGNPFGSSHGFSALVPRKRVP